MIRKLRRRHRWMTALATVVVVPLYFAALAARPERARQEILPEAATEKETSHRGLGLEFPSDPPFWVRDASNERAIVLDVPDTLEGADLLLYWLPAGSEFPEGAVVLGPMPGRGRLELALPPAVIEPGDLLLYSLGHAEVIARTAWRRHDRP